MSTYHDGSRRLQDRFDTRRLADRIDEKLVSRGRIDDDDRAFIERCDMVFVATADAEGRPNCSYKGGEPGFVRVLDERTIALPSYDGNGMYLSMGNLLVNPNVGLLFIHFEERKRLRLNGVASIAEDDPLGAEYPGPSSSCASAPSRCFRTARGTSTTTSWSPARASCRRRTARHRCPAGRRASGRGMRCRRTTPRATRSAR